MCASCSLNCLCLLSITFGKALQINGQIVYASLSLSFFPMIVAAYGMCGNVFWKGFFFWSRKVFYGENSVFCVLELFVDVQKKLKCDIIRPMCHNFH